MKLYRNAFSIRAMAMLRTHKVMTQAELAKETGLTTWTISRLENARENPTEDQMQRIMEALDWDDSLEKLEAMIEELKVQPYTEWPNVVAQRERKEQERKCRAECKR